MKLRWAVIDEVCQIIAPRPRSAWIADVWLVITAIFLLSHHTNAVDWVDVSSTTPLPRKAPTLWGKVDWYAGIPADMIAHFEQQKVRNVVCARTDWGNEIKEFNGGNDFGFLENGQLTRQVMKLWRIKNREWITEGSMEIISKTPLEDDIVESFLVSRIGSNQVSIRAHLALSPTTVEATDQSLTTTMHNAELTSFEEPSFNWFGFLIVTDPDKDPREGVSLTSSADPSIFHLTNLKYSVTVSSPRRLTPPPTQQYNYVDITSSLRLSNFTISSGAITAWVGNFCFGEVGPFEPIRSIAPSHDTQPYHVAAGLADLERPDNRQVQWITSNSAATAADSRIGKPVENQQNVPGPRVIQMNSK